MKLKLWLILGWVLLVSVNYAADNTVVLKACDGATLTIDRALAEKSPRLKSILQPKDSLDNTVTFQTVTGDSLQRLGGLLHFEQQHKNLLSCRDYIDFRCSKGHHILAYRKRREYQNKIGFLTDIFKQCYPDISKYEEIFQIADEFSMSVTKEVIAQIILSPELDLKELQEHKYVYSPLLQDAIAIQLQRRITLAKDKFFIDDKKDDPYLTGVSVQDIKYYRGNIDDLIDNLRNMLDLRGKRLNSLEGLEEILVKKQREGKPILFLNLSDNLLTEIPDNIPGIETIKILKLAKNKIKGFPDELSRNLLGWSEFIGWDSLEALDLRDNLLTEIPNNIRGTEKIKRLYLARNKIEGFPGEFVGELGIPSEFIGWDSLEALDLGENNIRYLPGKIAGLNALRVLWLPRNKVSIIPTEFEGLESLEFFNLESNDIREIPKDITGLSALYRLGLVGNPIMCNINRDEDKKRKIARLGEALFFHKRSRKESDSVEDHAPSAVF